MNATSAAVPVAIVGGGVWILQLIRLLADAPGCPPLDVRLVATDADRLAVIAGHGAQIVNANKGWRVSAVTIEEALEGAEICILLLREGNSAAREIDETFPASFGMVGDEGLGLGGFANAYRTMPVMTRIANEIRRRAPDVLTINLVAPLGLTTRALHAAGVPAFGLCELPITTERDLRATFGATDTDVPLNYAGLNHLGWFWSPDRLPDQLFAGAISNGMVSTATIAEYGALPLKYYAKMVSDRNHTIQEGASRARKLRAIAMRALQTIRMGGDPEPLLFGRSMPWLDQALTPLLLAVLNDITWTGFVNVAADGAANWCRPETVIEARGQVSRAGAQITVVSEPSSTVREFLTAAALSEDHIFEGFQSGEHRAAAVRAISDGPFHMAEPLVEEAAAAICRAAGMFLAVP